MTASLSEYTLRCFVDEIISETSGASIYCECTLILIKLLQFDASVYFLEPLNSYAAQIAFALETKIITSTRDIHSALTYKYICSMFDRSSF